MRDPNSCDILGAVEGRVYVSVEENVEAVNAYLRRLESDPGRVPSLAGWDWDRGSGPEPTILSCGLVRLKWY